MTDSDRKYKVIGRMSDLIWEQAEPINPIEDLIGGKIRVRRIRK